LFGSDDGFYIVVKPVVAILAQIAVRYVKVRAPVHGGCDGFVAYIAV
jgi:hypothetical protein